jgi:hypothetical protein
MSHSEGFARTDLAWHNEVDGSLGLFRGLHTQSRPKKGETPVVWFPLTELTELRTQNIKTISEFY